MEWVLKMEQSQHNLDRFHLKSGVTMADNRIAIMARGRLPGMREQIASLVLYFRISNEHGKWNAVMEQPQIIWPTIFPRQLEDMQRCNDTLIMVQDTADNEPFEVYSVSTTRKRADNKYQVHKKHLFTN